MAMQIGLSRVLLIAGAGYTSSILVRNGKFSDVIAELQALLNGSGEQSEGDSDKIASQMYNRLLDEIRSARQTVVLNANGAGQGNLTSLIVPAATLGAVGYGYMWWKGLKFSDLMYVTKRNMTAAVTNLTKSLDTVKEAVVNTKKHLTQRIQNLDDKVLEQNDLSKSIKTDVAGVQHSLTDLDFNLSQLQSLVSGLDWKICSLEEKQDFANMGVAYLCNFVSGKKVEMPGALQKQLKNSDNARGGRLLSYSEPSIMGLKEIADTVSARLNSDGIVQDDIPKLEEPSRNLLRSVSTKC
ncbi:hypothetical protein RchiOBHm_Chr4g0440531 [Rosa chinensis]|uniref:DUF1664 domain-containing protein n=1 Tax=Rosa chinensis TaxID=74649 RepID=A0A2P6R359_ROSCH|nr:uncharacterized protein LOC112198189 [Rosa chinensis]PRQ40848.1 hypothetical protein RchiOBHm_Chr4g0440531 [Rosa chinensis]